MGIGKEDIHRYKKEDQGKTQNIIWEWVMFTSTVKMPTVILGTRCQILNCFLYCFAL